jgi:hypothetical protein
MTARRPVATPKPALLTALAAALMLLVGPVGGCSSDDRRDQHYGTDAGSEYDLPPFPQADAAQDSQAADASGQIDGEIAKNSDGSADTSPEASADATTGE